MRTSLVESSLTSRLITRREALKATAMAAVAVPLFGSPALKGQTAPTAGAATDHDGWENGLRLGVASYSLRMLSLDALLAALKALRITNTALFRAHCEWETASIEECRAVGEKLRAAGIALHGSGVVNLPNDEVAARKAFENVLAAGMQTMVCKPVPDALPLVSRLAREYDLKLAIHNHGPEDSVYPTAAVIWEAVRSLDARVGICIDVGHSARAGEDPVGAIQRYASRIYDVHLKDSIAVPGSLKDLPVEIGSGRLDIQGMLRALLGVGYGGVVAIEYERPISNPLIGLAESVGYIRGALASFA